VQLTSLDVVRAGLSCKREHYDAIVIALLASMTN